MTESQNKKILTIPIHQNLSLKNLKMIVFYLNKFSKKKMKNNARTPLKIKLDERSKFLRSLIVQSLIGGGRGHMGSAMSLVEILRVIYDKVANISPKLINNPDRDRIILSKGHGCLALYAILADKKFIKTSELKMWLSLIQI